MNQPNDVTIHVLDGCNELAAADVPDVLLDACPGLGQPSGRIRAARPVRPAIRGDRTHRRTLSRRGTALASRVRRRVQGAGTPSATEVAHHREIVEAFFAASRGGDLAGLLAVLDPDVVLRADRTAVEAGAQAEVRGAKAVADMFSGRARFAQPALVDGAAGAVWAPGGQPRVVFDFTIEGDKIVAIDLLADAECLGQIDLTILGS